MGCGENVHLATWSSSEALQNSSFVKAAFFFNVVSAFQAHIINNCTYENKSHCHNIHSFQGIIHRMNTCVLMKMQTLKSHWCPEMSCHTLGHVLGRCLGGTGFFERGPDHFLRKIIMPSMPGPF